MLIEFSVSNFRSFREKQTFSMVAAPRLGKKGNVFTPKVVGEKLPPLLKVAAIYGPNASGKSNLLAALGIVKDILNLPPYRSNDTLPVAPFRFDPQLANQPSKFEYHFVADEQRYEFVLALTAERIVEEQLTAFPKGKETLLYRRSFTTSGEIYEFGSLEGESILHKAWQNLTGPKTLFISQAVTNSNESFQQLRKPFLWLEGNLKRYTRNLETAAQLALTFWNTFNKLDSSSDDNVADFLSKLDIPVSSVVFDLKDEADGGYNPLLKYSHEQEDETTRVLMESFNKVKATLTHKTAIGSAEFDFSEESEGTKNLIAFHLPWHLMMNTSDASKKWKTLVVDELDSSLHPKIVANLILQLLNSDKQAQLIFTTHDTHLMNTKILRRDQLWLTERDMNGATQLRSIHDFKGRETEDVEKRYYEGRYRGLPLIRKF